jgi:hypothetical protein
MSEADLIERVRTAMARIRAEGDDHPEGNAGGGAWETRGAPGWQAAVIRLGRPALLWMLGVVVMGWGVVVVGMVEAVWPGVGIRMAAAMAALLRAYPGELYLLLGTVFLGQAASSVTTAIKGKGR